MKSWDIFYNFALFEMGKLNEMTKSAYYEMKALCFFKSNLAAMWPELATFWTLGNFSKPLATSYLPNSPTFLGIFCKGVKIFKFSS